MFDIGMPCFNPGGQSWVRRASCLFAFRKKNSLTYFGRFKNVTIPASTGQGGGEKVWCESTFPSLPGDHGPYPWSILSLSLCHQVPTSGKSPGRLAPAPWGWGEPKETRTAGVFRADSPLWIMSHPWKAPHPWASGAPLCSLIRWQRASLNQHAAPRENHVAHILVVH